MGRRGLGRGCCAGSVGGLAGAGSVCEGEQTRPSGARAGGGLDRGGAAGAVMPVPKCVRVWRAEPMAARTGAGQG